MTATLPIGDTIITYPNEGLNPNQAVAIEHFLTRMRVVPKYSFRDDSFVGMFRTMEVMGTEFSVPRSIGENNPRKVDKDGDRRFRADRTRHIRITGRYDPFDLDFAVKEDTEVDSQINYMEDIVDRIQGAKARLPVQVALGALNDVNEADSGGLPNGLAFLVPAGLQWDKTNMSRSTNANPVKWNMQKLNYARSRLRYGNVGMGVQMCGLASPLTLDGFSTDELAINRDYNTTMLSPNAATLPGQYAIQGWGGLPWFEIPEFPDQSYIPNDDSGGVSRGGFQRRQVNSMTVIDEYILAKDSLLFLTSSQNQMFRVDIERDVKEHQLVVRFVAYVGAMVLNPKGIARVPNLFTAAL